MENFKKQIFKKLVVCIIFAVLTATVYIAVYVLFSEKTMFSAGFSTGLFAAWITIIIANAVRYCSTLKDPEKLKKLYIAETDERTRLIHEKTASGSFTASVFILGLTTLIASFFSETITYVLAGVIGVMAIVKVSFKFYYDRKY